MFVEIEMKAGAIFYLPSRLLVEEYWAADHRIGDPSAMVSSTIGSIVDGEVSSRVRDDTFQRPVLVLHTAADYAWFVTVGQADTKPL